MPHLRGILSRQAGCCAICLRPWESCGAAKRVRHETQFLQYLYVDHDHRSGQIRGLLCNACNTAIGLFDEDLARLAAAAFYLERRSHPRRAAAARNS
jgi:hypothetical protein